MKYDANFPLKLNHHVIVDRRDGSTYDIPCWDEDPTNDGTPVAGTIDPIFAMLKFIYQQVGLVIKLNNAKDRIGLLEFMELIKNAKMRLERPVFVDGIVRAGPFETQDLGRDEKNMELLAQRFAALAATDEDIELSRWFMEFNDDVDADRAGRENMSPNEELEAQLEGLPEPVKAIIRAKVAGMDIPEGMNFKVHKIELVDREEGDIEDIRFVEVGEDGELKDKKDSPTTH